jgi:CheY-like chemotaxis protein
MSKRILVVEDQADNRQMIRDMPAPTDCEIAEAENGEESATSKGRSISCATRTSRATLRMSLPARSGRRRKFLCPPSRIAARPLF